MNLGRGDFESVLDASCTCRICGNGEVSRIIGNCETRSQLPMKQRIALSISGEPPL